MSLDSDRGHVNVNVLFRNKLIEGWWPHTRHGKLPTATEERIAEFVKVTLAKSRTIFRQHSFGPSDSLETIDVGH